MRGSAVCADLGLQRSPRLGVAGLTQANRIVGDRIDHQLHIFRRQHVFALENGADDLFHFVTAGQVVRAERIEQEIRRIDGRGLHRRFVSGIGDRPCPVALVEFQPVGVLGPDRRVGAERRIVGEAFEIELGAERTGLLAHPLIERGADPPPRAAERGGDQLEIREADIGCVQQERHAERLVARILRHEQARDEAVFQRIGELLGELVDVVSRHGRKLLAHDGLRRFDGRAVRRRRGVGHFADTEHGSDAKHVRRWLASVQAYPRRCGRSFRHR